MSHCGVCAMDSSTAILKYRCPRCLSPLCSKKCYSEHNIECTEMFYRDRVKSVLRFEDNARGKIEKGQADDSRSGSERSTGDDLETVRTKQAQLAHIAEKLIAANMASSMLSKEEQQLLHEAVGAFDYAQGQNNIIVTKLPWWREISGKDYGEEDHSLGDLDNDDVKLPVKTSNITTLMPSPLSLEGSRGKPLIEEISERRDDNNHDDDDNDNDENYNNDGLADSPLVGESSGFGCFRDNMNAIIQCVQSLSVSSSSSSSSSSSLHLQVVALLLSYVDTKRSVSAELMDESECYAYLTQTSPLFYEGKQGLESQDSHLMPSSDRTHDFNHTSKYQFKPLNMKDVLESWLQLKHPLERHCLRAVVEDLVLMINVSSGFGIVYALIESWLLCFYRQHRNAHQLVIMENLLKERSSESCEKSNKMLEKFYRTVYTVPMKKKKNDRDVDAERCSRKIFFILLQLCKDVDHYVHCIEHDLWQIMTTQHENMQ